MLSFQQLQVIPGRIGIHEEAIVLGKEEDFLREETKTSPPALVSLDLPETDLPERLVEGGVTETASALRDEGRLAPGTAGEALAKPLEVRSTHQRHVAQKKGEGTGLFSQGFHGQGQRTGLSPFGVSVDDNRRVGS